MDNKHLRNSIEDIKMSNEMKSRIIHEVAKQTKSNSAQELNRNMNGNVKRFATVALVVTMILATTGVAYALFTSEWLSNFFSAQSNKPLTTSQYEFIEENSVGIGQSVTADGYTITVDSAICDQDNLFVVVNIQGPENINLEDESIRLSFGHLEAKRAGADNQTGHLIGATRSWVTLEDGDALDNTATILMKQTRTMSEDSNISFADGELWRFHFADLRTRDENNEKTILAEGGWSFEFYLYQVGDEIELISEPIICKANTGGEGAMSDELDAKTTVDIMVTSIRLSPFGAVCTHTYGINERVESVDILDIQLVMSDGTTVIAQPKSGGGSGAIGANTGTMVYTFNAPVMLDEVEYLVLPSNVQVPITGDKSHLVSVLRPTEDEILEDYHKAQQAISWFESSTAPLNYEVSKEHNGNIYYKVTDFQYDTDFLIYLYSIFAPEVIKPYFSDEETRIYQTIDGELYCLDVGGRGTDPSKGGETHDIYYEDDDTVILTVTVEILDTEKDFEIIGTEDFTFKYEYVDGKWVFTKFPVIR